jgi:acetyl-CoA C-acetyltransferase
MQLNEAIIYDAVRTPRSKGKPDGSLHQVRPITLVKTVLDEIRDRNDLDTSYVDDVILGCVSQVFEQGGCIAKAAALHAEYDEGVAGMTLNRFCSSGLEAVNQAASNVMTGYRDLIVAGGVESMSRIPILSDGGAWMIDPDLMMKTRFVPQGVSADLIATLKGYTRNDVDQLAAESQKRAAEAVQAGHFNKSVVAVKDATGATILDQDNYFRAGTTVEKLSELRPAFAKMGEDFGFDAMAISKYPQVEKINHVHHAGNSSGIVDGAAGVLIGTKEIGKELGLKPRARYRSFALTSGDPTIMLTGPVPATHKALKMAGMDIKDIDLVEINEAFASVVLNFVDEMGLNMDKVNVNGGAIALGHPLGATGAMILGTVLDELERRNLSTGLVTLCIGGGMGVTTIIERV